MSAIDELCCILDERGIKWHEAGDTTFFGASVYETCYAASEPECGIALNPLTPEQAIAVTVGRETCHTVLMDCFGNPPYNKSGLQGNDVVCGCSECGAPWGTTGLFRGNKFKHNFKACPICGRKVI